MRIRLEWVAGAILFALVADACASTNVFSMPLIYPKHMQLLQELKQTMREGKTDAMETVCRQGVALMPDDPTWQYNLACALAYRADKDEALKALDRAIDLGFRNDAAIAADSDLRQLQMQPGFAALVAKAKRLNGKPIEGVVPIKPTTVCMGLPAEINASNTLWDFDQGCFVTLFSLVNPDLRKLSAFAPSYQGPAAERVRRWFADETASGNFGDLYVNRDGGHSALAVTNFPGLTPVVYCEAARQHRAHLGLPNARFEQPVIGNSSMSMVSGPFWRSMPRAALTDPYQPIAAFRYYVGNQCWFYPEHKDYDPETGDLFPANTPYYVISQGSSFSDQPFMQAFAAAMAALQPATKRYLISNKLLAPTLQMIFRSTLKNVKTPEDYLKGVAHPAVFDHSNLNPEGMADLAHALRPDDVPPLVLLRTQEDAKSVMGVDYFDLRPEGLFDTPCCIARVVRGVARERRMTISAEVSFKPAGEVKYQWVLLQGDPQKVTIHPLADNGSRVEIGVSYHGTFRLSEGGLPLPMSSSRVDIGCFVKSGKYYSAPSFVSFFYLPNEERVYRDDGQILSVDYRNAAHRYADPVLTLQKNWKDLYEYDAQGHMLGWYRTREGQAERFTRDGYRVLSTDKLNRPVKACAVEYLPRQTGVEGAPPALASADTPRVFTYAYTGDSDKLGKAAPNK